MKRNRPRKTVQAQRRNIEDAPFFKFKYDGDDILPLDPGKSFIQEQIGKSINSYITDRCVVL